ncbi:hypothetical protein Y023_4963 [Burkholderia pseudomallei A79D]|nr:hypothetical protein Y023_4963 [Burkholderia pseudomallei A79D]KGX97872.1 hypothetical protein X997_4638 [Burkholderia pseudomallei A79C]
MLPLACSYTNNKAAITPPVNQAETLRLISIKNSRISSRCLRIHIFPFPKLAGIYNPWKRMFSRPTATPNDSSLGRLFVLCAGLHM